MHVTPTVGQLTAYRETLRSTSTSKQLVYNGGIVQTAPKVYVVFWGSSWTGAGDPSGQVQNRLLSFLGQIGGSGWLNAVTQYTQRGGATVGNAGTIFGGSYVDTGSSPPSRPTTSQLMQEAYNAANHFGDLSGNANFIVALPSGSHPSGFATQWCSYHSAFGIRGTTTVLAFTVLPYMPDAGSGCGAGSASGSTTPALDGVTIVAGHEQAEVETDPQLNAWYDTAGNEIGDKCAWVNLELNPAAAGFATQPLWSNADGGCVQHYP